MEKLIVTFADARRLKLIRFYTGVPCARNHDAERYVSTGGCVECKTGYVPGKRTARTETRMFSPLRAIAFAPGTTPMEAQLAFRFLAQMGWYDAAVAMLRADPVALARVQATLTELQLQDFGMYKPLAPLSPPPPVKSSP